MEMLCAISFQKLMYDITEKRIDLICAVLQNLTLKQHPTTEPVPGNSH